MAGTLTVEAVETNGAPISQAAMRVYEKADGASKSMMECYTSEEGPSEPIIPPIPGSTHSLHSIPQACPYAQHDIRVIKDDFDKGIVNGIQIFSNTNSTLVVIM